MQNLQPPGATTASSALAEALQRRRIHDRIDASPALADALATLAFGPARREDLADLAALTASRTGSAVHAD